MSKAARRLAATYASVIVNDCRTEQDVAALLYPLVLQADANRTLRRELRRAARRREAIIRRAARPAPQPRGFTDLTPGRFVTTLAPPPGPRRVNGHSLDVSVSPAELFPRPEFE